MALVHVLLGRAVLTSAVVVCVASPGFAARHARLSADLEGHLAAGSPTIDVIVHGTRAEVTSLAARYNVRIARHLRSGAVLRVSAGQLAALREDQLVDHLSGNARFRATELTAESIGADQVWAGTRARSLTGAGVTIAVIDSGIDSRHSALRKRVLATVDFTGGNGQDQYGHGTHVAAIIAGQAGQLAETADYRGIAPGAFLVNLRVLGADGSGYASDVIDAIDWAIEHRRAYNIKVINLSLGTPVLQSYRDDPVCEAVERALEAGLAVVVAAGNHGRTADGKRIYGGVLSPGNHPKAITVGAIDTHGTAFRSDDTVASYSSRGPTAFDLALKPDLVAPGSHIVSAEAADSYLATTYAHRHVAGAGAGAFMQLSGTSMATGVVSGAVALLLEQSNRLSPREVKAVLQMTGSFMPGAGLMASGAGSVNVLAAAEFVADGSVGRLPSTSIGGEPESAGGFAYFHRKAVFPAQSSLHRYGNEVHRTQTGFWGAAVVWGGTIIWGSTIVWGGSAADTIVWGGTANGDTIVWGGSTNGDTIVWGGTTNGDTIVWGGTTSGDTIVWGGTTNGDTIVWGGSVRLND